MIKYPPMLLCKDEKASICASIPLKYRDMLYQLGDENVTAGIVILVYNNENKIKKHLERLNNKVKVKKTRFKNAKTRK